MLPPVHGVGLYLATDHDEITCGNPVPQTAVVGTVRYLIPKRNIADIKTR